jgi:hypothetical protein
LYVDCGNQHNIPACEFTAEEKKKMTFLQPDNAAALETLVDKAERMKDSLIIVEGLFSLLRNEFGG